MLQFPLQRALLGREYANGTYSLGAYYVALQASNLILSALSSALLALPVYALVGLAATAGQAGYFVLVLALMSLIGSSLGVIVGATTADIDSARSAIVPTLVPLLIFSGYLIPLEKIAPYFKWAYYASFFQCAPRGQERGAVARRGRARTRTRARAQACACVRAPSRTTAAGDGRW